MRDKHVRSEVCSEVGLFQRDPPLATDLSHFIRQHRFSLTFGKAETNNLQEFCESGLERSHELKFWVKAAEWRL